MERLSAHDGSACHPISPRSDGAKGKSVSLATVSATAAGNASFVCSPSEFRIGAYAGVVNQFERTDPTRSTTANFVPRQWRVVPHSLLVPSNR